MEKWEVDIRSRTTGNSLITVFKTNDHDKAWKLVSKANDILLGKGWERFNVDSFVGYNNKGIMFDAYLIN